MPPVEIPVEKWPGKVREVTIGGNGRKSVTVGGESALPFLSFEGQIPNRPRIAIEVVDMVPEDWADNLVQAWGDAMKSPAAWAKKAAEYGADLICLSLDSAHPDGPNTGPKEAVESVTSVLEAVDLPLIVLGPGVADKDNEVLTAVADAASGQRIVLGFCEEKNYRTIVAAALAGGHLVIAKTPIEINLAKQLNILVSDMGLPPDRILMDPTTGALGYGLEYVYSVMERLRLAALQGDSMTQIPIINIAGKEAWRQKEAKAAQGVPDFWGDAARRGILWEEITASELLLAGSDILVMRHPEAVQKVKATIDSLMGS